MKAILASLSEVMGVFDGVSETVKDPKDAAFYKHSTKSATLAHRSMKMRAKSNNVRGAKDMAKAASGFHQAAYTVASDHSKPRHAKLVQAYDKKRHALHQRLAKPKSKPGDNQGDPDDPTNESAEIAELYADNGEAAKRAARFSRGAKHHSLAGNREGEAKARKAASDAHKQAAQHSIKSESGEIGIFGQLPHTPPKYPRRSTTRGFRPGDHSPPASIDRRPWTHVRPPEVGESIFKPLKPKCQVSQKSLRDLQVADRAAVWTTPKVDRRVVRSPDHASSTASITSITPTRRTTSTTSRKARSTSTRSAPTTRTLIPTSLRSRTTPPSPRTRTRRRTRCPTSSQSAPRTFIRPQSA
jgi:hypothetical protein